MRKMIIAANWKMNKCKDESLDFILKINNKVPDKKKIETIIFPQATLLDALIKVKGENLKIGAQNVFYMNEGAYTGEISPKNIKNLGIKYVIIGHSERRLHFGENDHIINLKLLSSLSNDIYPIVCIGEYIEELKKKEKTKIFLNQQIENILQNINPIYIKNIILAYEPIWAIGKKDKKIDPKQINKIIKSIRNKISFLFDKMISEKIRIIYGGSVSIFNAEYFLIQKEIDGILIGKNSLDISNFLSFMEIAKKIKK
ncbi:triose-phosphate isomerase [Candidatus Phytoplasma sacchari]|nr:triose-phosphate isomerase [Candidatus Phytoplasma sacchari]KAB8122649.1 triose-phosphate isomerase [Candidatus Phytoplasma sacchari]